MPVETVETAPLLQQPVAPDNEDTSVLKRVKEFLTRKLFLAIGSLLAILIVLGLSLSFGLRVRKSSESKLCTTEACIHASSEILYNLSPNYKNIDPCLNFEELVCGGWSDRHDLRPDQGDAFTGSLMDDNTKLILKHVLETPYQNVSKVLSLESSPNARSADKEIFNKIKTAYDVCMNISTIRNQGIKPLVEVIRQIIDLFPVTESDIRKNEPLTASDEMELSEALIFLQKLGIDSLLLLGPTADDKNPDTVVIQAFPPLNIGLPAKDYYESTSVLQKYTAALTQVFNNLESELWQSNSNLDSLKSKKKKDKLKESIPTYLAAEVVDFEKSLSRASPDSADINDVTVFKYYNVLPIQEADELTPQIHLSHMINQLSPPAFTAKSLIVAFPSYLKSLNSILKESPKGVIQAYLIWKCIQSFSTVIEAEEIKPYTRFANVLQGKDPESTIDRSVKCISHLDGGLGWILSRFFIEKAFSENAKKIGNQIVLDIRERFIEKLKNTSWMDPNTAKLAIGKVEKIVQKIGFPSKSPNILDPIDLKEYYSLLKISPKNYFKNSLSIRRFQIARIWHKLGKPVNRDEWDLTIPTVNAYYNPPGNEIVFPAGIMQFPVFNAGVPQYLNYGAFGSVAGHELSHAFDSMGRHYDQNGNYTDWWDNETIANFEHRSQCFVDQYSNFTVPGLDGTTLHVNGKLTLGENIADAGGVSASFAAWKKRQSTVADFNLPGLEYFSQDQLFFVSFGNWWCGSTRKEKAVSRIFSDPHSPKKARILGTMANSRDFRESFNCPSKEPVCELW
ncbi:Endothelin-converting enzyme 1 [Golovinomyces cichoracearum]|uniref:Endothelin-converting enzyme 1 n=1 Tax=Golovinomyces cichoracearum TaxID=62708 RepID=A0A420INU1_9PEZI|nr:Endothelin-converting enzyme 1 [Golovinomyces cichoracearum]